MGSRLNSESVDSFPPAHLKLGPFPNSLAASLAVLRSMSAFPKSSIRPVGLPIYVARLPSAPFARRGGQALRTAVSDWQSREALA
jgi:hypothetical protein